MQNTIPKATFVSYSHQQGEWVLDCLCPTLVAAGATILVDRERFRAGVALFDQMDAVQDQAEIHILIFSPDYLASKACQHEMYRAIATDPLFARGSVIPVVRVPCDLPSDIAAPNPLRVDLTDDTETTQWDMLLEACRVDLGTAVPDWLTARERVRSHLGRQESVNLIVKGEPKRAEFLARIRQDLGELCEIDLDSGKTVPRRGLASEMLSACGVRVEVPHPPEDLATLTQKLEKLTTTPTLCLRHFDRVRLRNYGPDFFSTLYDLVIRRKLVLLIESRTHYSQLLPDVDGCKVSYDLPLITVELKGRRG